MLKERSSNPNLNRIFTYLSTSLACGWMAIGHSSSLEEHLTSSSSLELDSCHRGFLLHVLLLVTAKLLKLGVGKQEEFLIPYEAGE